MAGAGALDRRISFQRQAAARDSMGGSTDEGWVELIKVWAKRVDANDAERQDSAERSATRVTRWKVRSSTIVKTVTPVDRILFDGDDYQIEGIKETKEGRNNYLWFTTVVRND